MVQQPIQRAERRPDENQDDFFRRLIRPFSHPDARVSAIEYSPGSGRAPGGNGQVNVYSQQTQQNVEIKLERGGTGFAALFRAEVKKNNAHGAGTGQSNFADGPSTAVIDNEADSGAKQNNHAKSRCAMM